MNTSPAESSKGHVEIDKRPPEPRLPRFVLSSIAACQVEIVQDQTEQTRPSRTEAELLADGQCEV